MGLDMFAWRVAKEDALGDFDIGKDETGSYKKSELHYWRKHHDLHGWMENLYYSKGGKENTFNCIPVRLSLEDLSKLEKDIKSRLLPETHGFFFGNNPPDDDSDNEDLIFIQKAREAIAAGDVVYYDSWW
jgi:hypothetical protein